ncbi:MAG: hypothetical protein WD048_01280 [Chitinophagales bacterium]
MGHQTLTIQVNSEKALKLIEQLEALNLIKVIKHSPKKNKTKLSKDLEGSITTEESDLMHQELDQMRKEWERNS